MCVKQKINLRHGLLKSQTIDELLVDLEVVFSQAVPRS